MSPLLVFIVIWAGLMGSFLGLLALDAMLEFPIRAYLRHRGPQEECPKCHDTVPVGTLAKVAESHATGISALFGSSVPRLDGSWMERGLVTWGRSGTTCSECRTMHVRGWQPKARRQAA